MKLRLKEKRDEGGDVHSWIWEPEQAISWKAGQYLEYHLSHSNPDDRGEDRYFTISSAPFEQYPRITTRLASQKSSSFKEALARMAVGDQIEVSEPSGDFVVDEPSQKYAFLAGGIGITPFRSILLQMNHDHQLINVTLLYSNRTSEATFKNELEPLTATNPNFRIEYVIDPQRIEAELIKAKLPDWQGRIFYVSGPVPMVEAVDKILAGMGISEEQIKNDDFPNYTWP